MVRRADGPTHRSPLAEPNTGDDPCGVNQTDTKRSPVSADPEAAYRAAQNRLGREIKTSPAHTHDVTRRPETSPLEAQIRARAPRTPSSTPIDQQVVSLRHIVSHFANTALTAADITTGHDELGSFVALALDRANWGFPWPTERVIRSRIPGGFPADGRIVFTVDGQRIGGILGPEHPQIPDAGVCDRMIRTLRAAILGACPPVERDDRAIALQDLRLSDLQHESKDTSRAPLEDGQIQFGYVSGCDIYYVTYDTRTSAITTERATVERPHRGQRTKVFEIGPAPGAVAANIPEIGALRDTVTPYGHRMPVPEHLGAVVFFRAENAELEGRPALLLDARVDFDPRIFLGDAGKAAAAARAAVADFAQERLHSAGNGGIPVEVRVRFSSSTADVSTEEQMTTRPSGSPEPWADLLPARDLQGWLALDPDVREDWLTHLDRRPALPQGFALHDVTGSIDTLGSPELRRFAQGMLDAMSLDGPDISGDDVPVGGRNSELLVLELPSGEIAGGYLYLEQRVADAPDADPAGFASAEAAIDAGVHIGTACYRTWSGFDHQGAMIDYNEWEYDH